MSNPMSAASQQIHAWLTVHPETEDALVTALVAAYRQVHGQSVDPSNWTTTRTEDRKNEM